MVNLGFPERNAQWLFYLLGACQPSMEGIARRGMRQRLWGPLMLMWEWQAGKRCTGVSRDPDRAIQEAERHLAVGDSARVERVVAVLSFRTMSSLYVPTGHGWTATRRDARPGILATTITLSRNGPARCRIPAPPPAARIRERR